MKKVINIISALLIILLLSCSTNSEWENVKEIGSMDAYQKFIDENPGNQNISTAEHLIDSLDNVFWETAKNEDIIEAYEKYINENDKGKYKDEAKKMIKDLAEKKQEINDWNDAVEFDIVGEYEDFIKKYPESNYINEAEKRIFLLKKPDYKTNFINLVNFFEALSTNDFERLTKFFAEKVYFEVIGNDYERRDSISRPLNKKILDNFGYWNVGSDIIYKTFLYGTYLYDSENTCEVNIEDDGIDIEFEYWDNGSAGNFILHWINQEGDWRIDQSIIYLPSFM